MRLQLRHGPSRVLTHDGILVQEHGLKFRQILIRTNIPRHHTPIP
jgi:hypothetical protein